MTWSSQLPEDLKIKIGDILECTYTWEGHIQLRLNSRMLLDFDVERPLDRHASYYPVVDVSGATSMLSFLPASGSATVGDLSTCIPDEFELEDPDIDDMISVGELEAGDLRNGFNFQGVLVNAAPIAGLAGNLVLSAAGEWHKSLMRLTEDV
jgi:hypothetical protein